MIWFLEVEALPLELSFLYRLRRRSNRRRLKRPQQVVHLLGLRGLLVLLFGLHHQRTAKRQQSNVNFAP